MVLRLHHLCDRLRVTQNVRLARGYDDDALRAERQPGAATDTQSARALENVMGCDRLKRGIGEPPSSLDFANGKGVQPDSQCCQEAIKDVHRHQGLQ